MSFFERTCLVTGGAGFVGRHLVKRLLDAGAMVTVVDPLVSGTGALDPTCWPLCKPWHYSRFDYVNIDCRDWFKSSLAMTQYDYVFHLAAVVGGRNTIENNPLAVADDLSIDAAYWQWAAKTKPSLSVVFSSSAVYPICLQRKDSNRMLQEDDARVTSDYIGLPDMTYGWAKLTCEYLAHIASIKHGLRSICFRPFSGYGEDQDLSYPFPAICDRAIDGKANTTPLFYIWGSGQQLRDFIYIEDCIDAILAMSNLEREDSPFNGSTPASRAINLSTGILTSFNQLAYDICSQLDYYPKIQGNDTAPEGVFARGGCTSKQRHYGFTAKTPLPEGISKVLSYLIKEKAHAG